MLTWCRHRYMGAHGDSTTRVRSTGGGVASLDANRRHLGSCGAHGLEGVASLEKWKQLPVVMPRCRAIVVPVVVRPQCAPAARGRSWWELVPGGALRWPWGAARLVVVATHCQWLRPGRLSTLPSRSSSHHSADSTRGRVAHLVLVSCVPVGSHALATGISRRVGRCGTRQRLGRTLLVDR